jgi:TATA-binding protein-associated factor Taf7
LFDVLGPVDANVEADANEQELPPRTNIVRQRRLNSAEEDQPQPLSNDTFTRFAELMMQQMEEDWQNRLQRERECDEERREEQHCRDEERREERRRRDEDHRVRRELMAMLQDLQDALSDYLHRN